MSTPHKPADDPTIGRLVADASRDLSALMQSEIQLAKSELKVSVKSGGIGAALFGVVAFFALLLIILLSITTAFFLTMTGLHPAWAFLIVSGFYLLLMVVLTIAGIRLIKKVSAPEQTISTAKAIPAVFKRSKAAPTPSITPTD